MNENVKKSRFFGHRFNIAVSVDLKEAFTALCDREGSNFPIREDMSYTGRGVNYNTGHYVNAVIKYMIAETVRLGKLPFDTTNLYVRSGFITERLDGNIPIRIDVDHKDEFTRICKAARVPITRVIRFYISMCVANDQIIVRPTATTSEK